MDEATYWTALEYRICREFAGMAEVEEAVRIYREGGVEGLLG